MKKAFTLLELVFVVVVIGILAALIIPNTRTNPLQEAAIQVLSDIRYTQHLAMVDDRYNPASVDSANLVKWYKERWQIIFSANAGSGGQMGYTVFSDFLGDSTGNPDAIEIAVNPADNSKRLTGGWNNGVVLDIDNAAFVGSEKLNIERSYGVSGVAFSATCSVNGSTRIAFDHLGRPIQGNLSSNNQPYDNADLIQANCNIVLTHTNGDTITIRLQPETGYACILNAAGNCI